MNVNNKFVLNFKQDSIHPIFSRLKTRACSLPPGTISWARAWSCSLGSPAANKRWNSAPAPFCCITSSLETSYSGFGAVSIEGIAQQEPGKARNYVAFPVLPDSPRNCSGPPELGFFSEVLLLKLWVIIKSAGELFVTESCSQSQTRTNCLACCAI